MNHIGTPRLTCRVVRLKNALLDRDGPLTGHAAHCPDCQAWYRADDTLVQTLRRDARREEQPVPTDLAERIARSVRQASPRPRRSRLPVVIGALAGAAAIIAFSIVALRQEAPAPSHNPPRDVTAALSPVDTARLLADFYSLRLRVLDSVEPAAMKLTTENPLARELNSVQADARAAFGFLVLNFVPASAAESRVEPDSPEASRS